MEATTPYSDMITHLEKRGIVETMATQSMMATDPRKFRILVSLPESRASYRTEYYDVDCIGSSLMYDLTDTVVELYNSS